VITRRSGALNFDAITAPTLAALLEALEPVRRLDRELALVDLTLGGWRGNAAADEILGQLDCERENVLAPSSLPPFERSADFIGKLVDQEGAGDLLVQRCLELAERILAAAERHREVAAFVVLMPLPGLPLGRANSLLIEFIAQGLPASRRLLLVRTTSGTPDLPPRWVCEWRGDAAGAVESPSQDTDLVPGVLTSAVANALSGAAQLIPLRHGFLVPPERRLPPSAYGRLAFDRLAARTAAWGWLQAYAQVHGNRYFVDTKLLRTEAGARFFEGAPDIALCLLSRALACVDDPLERAVLQATMQGMLIAQLRFEEAAQLEPPPAITLPVELRGALALSKAWGLVMSDQAKAAETYFAEAEQLLAKRAGCRENLYLMNIRALNRLKLGDPDGAAAIERDIERRLNALPVPDWQLVYINSINQARLHRRARRYDQALVCYDRAFATCHGARSLSDLVYGNACAAMLAADRGAMEESFLAWLRAALHWLASAAPESFAQRAARTIVGRSIRTEEDVVEAVSVALARSVSVAAKAVGALPTHAGESAATFVQPARLPSPPAFAFGGPGWGLLACETAAPVAFTGTEYDSLRALVTTILHDRAPAVAPLRTIAVDDQLGRDVPTVITEMLASALRWNAPSLAFAGVASIVLDAPLCHRLEQELRVQLAPIVANVLRRPEGLRFEFKRYLPPCLVREPLAALVSLADGRRAADLRTAAGPAEELLPALRLLEEARILDLSLTGDGCLAAGLDLQAVAGHGATDGGQQ
jgi:tetratricopeptide (TPR) repeat protein